METIVVNGVTIDHITSDIATIRPAGQEANWHVDLIDKQKFLGLKTEDYLGIIGFHGDYELLQDLNNYAVKIGFKGAKKYADDIVMIPHILYIYSDLAS